MLGIPLSLPRKEIHIANKSMRQEQTAACAHAYMLQCGLTQSQVKENEYTPKERAKMGRYGTENRPSKVNRHFSQLVDGKLPHSLSQW